MSRKRDIANVSVHSNSFTGVQDIEFNPSAEELPFSGDDSQSLQDIQVTKIKSDFSISVIDPTHKRDITGVFFGNINFTADDSTDVITSAGHGLNDGDQIRVFSTTTLPDPLAINTTYFVRDKTTDTFKVAATSGGTAINIADTGTGTHSFQRKLGEALKFSGKAGCKEIVDSADSDLFITFIEVSEKYLEASVESRDVGQVLNLITIGELGQLDVVVPIGSTTSGLIGSEAEIFTFKNMTVLGTPVSGKHADLATATINFKGIGGSSADIENTLTAGGSTVFEINPGDTGTVSYDLKGTGGDSDITVTISNARCLNVEIMIEHASRLERKFDFSAVSTDGTTRPVAIS